MTNSGVFRYSAIDPDDVRDMLCLNGWGDHTRVVKQRGDFLYRVRATSARQVLVAEVATRLTQVVHATTPVPLLHVPITGASTCRIGRREMQAFPGQALMLAPGQEYTLISMGGEWLVLSIAPEFLFALMQPGDSRSGKPRSIVSSELSLSPGARQALVRAVRRLLDAAESGPIGLDENPVEQELDRWLSLHVAGTANIQFISPSSRARVRAMKAWIDRHFKEPISLEELCNAVRMSKRSLQYLCMAGFGMTPMEVVQWRRLAEVRRVLERAGPGTTVTDTALNNGVTHLGRFSVMYREVYGELPSATLARSTGARGCILPSQRLLSAPPARRRHAPRPDGLGHRQISPPSTESSGPGPSGQPPRP